MWFWFFILSFGINIFALFYIKWLLSTVAIINEDMSNLSEMIQKFSIHLKTIYEMEMFYGDDNLKSLMNHANEISERLSGLDLLLNEEEDQVEET